MNLAIPPSLAPMTPMLHEFFEAMLFKLAVNSHKDALGSDDVDGLLAKMAEEIQEFRDQRVQDADDPNVLAELADTSNFAFLLYAFLRKRGVNTLREQFLNEYFIIDPHMGRIYCKKTRAGSPLKVGDEVKGRGTTRYIRAQHSISGATVSLPRRDIIWWASSGNWPPYPLSYRNWPEHGTDYTDRPSYDAITNLQMQVEPPDFPFVSQYKPKGKENVANYSKWRYQRRHKMALVVVGYWDTKEEAAREGLKAWKVKTRG